MARCVCGREVQRVVSCDVCNFKKGVPTWSETITFCTSIHSWLVFDLGRDEWVIWRMATVGIPLCRRDGRYVRRSADGLLERREDWDRKQGRRWHTEELLKEFTGRYERPPGLGSVFFKRFTESFYIWLLDGDEFRSIQGEREEKEREKWTDGVGWGLSLCTVWLSACGYSMVQLKLSQQHLTCTGHTSIHTDLLWKQTCNTDYQATKRHFNFYYSNSIIVQ